MTTTTNHEIVNQDRRRLRMPLRGVETQAVTTLADNATMTVPKLPEWDCSMMDRVEPAPRRMLPRSCLSWYRARRR